MTNRRSMSPDPVALDRLAHMPASPRSASAATNHSLLHHRDQAGAGVSPLQGRATILLAGLTTVGILTAGSLLISAMAVRLLLGDQPGLLSTALLALGAVGGTSAGVWLSQPALTRFVSRLLRLR